MNNMQFTPSNSQVVAFSINSGTKQIDTHGGYNGAASGYYMCSKEHFKLIYLLNKLSLKISILNAGGYTVPVSGIYQVASEFINGSISNCSIGIHSFKAGDVVPVKSYGKTSIHRIQ